MSKVALLEKEDPYGIGKFAHVSFTGNEPKVPEYSTINKPITEFTKCKLPLPSVKFMLKLALGLFVGKSAFAGVVKIKVSIHEE